MHIPELHGLILGGGESRRMGRDKALLSYHGRTQIETVQELLSPLVVSAHLSCRPGQWPGRFPSLPRIEDLPAWEGKGPSGGILSAMDTRPEAAWLVVACDLPWLTADTLQDLIDRRDPACIATAYRSSSDGLPEPLCAIYEPAAADRLKAFVADGKTCPRKFLIRSGIPLLALKDPHALDNVNNAEEYEAAWRQLRGKESG